jgi:hypothetical protein
MVSDLFDQKNLRKSDVDPSAAAKTLSNLGAAKGGKARAAKLTPEQRHESAKAAALARWSGDLPRATHMGFLHIASMNIPCFVLKDGRRVISGRGMTTAIGMRGRGQGITRITTHTTLKPFISDELRLAIETPIRFLGSTSRAGNPTFGYEATILNRICDAILDARRAKALKTEQELRYAQFCEILVRAFAEVGIIALVDEATGHQADRGRDALEAILQKFLSVELCKWAKTFSDEFYNQLFRLRKIDVARLSTARPQYLGHITNDIVYERLAPEVLEHLKVRTPRTPSGGRKYRFHQYLTRDIGHPKLREHLAAVEALMKISPDYNTFYESLNKALPKWKDMPLFEELGD